MGAIFVPTKGTTNPAAEAEKEYPLDFCLWLHKNFDALIQETKEAKSFKSFMGMK